MSSEFAALMLLGGGRVRWMGRARVAGRVRSVADETDAPLGAGGTA